MSHPTEEQTGEQSREPNAHPFGVGRRPLLAALGAGAAATLGSGLAAAERDDDGAEIHEQFGYSTPDATDLPEGLSADHEVELHLVLAPEESPDHAPFYAHFQPTGLQVAPGDVVQFTFQSPDHTVTAYHPGQGYQRRVPEGVPAFSSPLVNVDGAWLYRLDQEGVYDLFCAAHHVFGMNARVVVGDLAPADVPAYADTFEGSEDPLLFAPWSAAVLEAELNAFSDRNEDVEWPYLTPQAVLGTDALDPARIQEQGEVSFDAVREELGYPDPEA